MAKHYFNSKLIDWVQYEDGALEVFSKNHLTLYFGVPEETYKEFISQKNPDTFFRNIIRKNFVEQNLF